MGMDHKLRSDQSFFEVVRSEFLGLVKIAVANNITVYCPTEHMCDFYIYIEIDQTQIWFLVNMPILWRLNIERIYWFNIYS